MSISADLKYERTKFRTVKVVSPEETVMTCQAHRCFYLQLRGATPDLWGATPDLWGPVGSDRGTPLPGALKS